MLPGESPVKGDGEPMRLRFLVQMLLGISLVSGGYAERVPMPVLPERSRLT